MKVSAAPKGGRAPQDRLLPGFDSRVIFPLTGGMRSAAAALALRRFAENSGEAPGEGVSGLRDLAARQAALLAFRRLLARRAVPFEPYCPNPLAAGPGFGITIGGRACLLAPCPEPGPNGQVYLDGPGKRLARMHGPEGALVVFFFSRQGPGHAAAGFSARYAAALPAMWLRPRRWAPLDDLRLRFEGNSPGSLTLTGLDKDRNFRARTVRIPAGESVAPGAGWHSLAALCSPQRPDCRLRITSPHPGAAACIAPHHWQDLFQPLAACGFPGYISLSGLKRQCAGSGPLALRSLESLFLQVQAWAGTNSPKGIAFPPGL